MLMIMSFFMREGYYWGLSKCSREGVGGRLLQAAIQYTFSFQGIEEIELCLNTNNQGAMNLYKKAGFEEKLCLQHYIIE